MKQKKTFLTLILIIVALCLTAAYAAISSQNLTITGNVSAIAGEGNVKVQFVEAEVDPASKGTVSAEPNTGDDYTKATISVADLSVVGDTATVVYTIENKAPDMAATLATPSVEWANKEWFDVKCELSGVDLAKNSDQSTADTQTATVTVTLLKTPVSEADQNAATDSVTISINASPVENSGV